MIKILLTDQLPSGKNQIKETFVKGRKVRYPDARFKAWRTVAARQIVMQLPLPWRTITTPCIMAVKYWPGDLLKRDVPGMEDAICHLIEHAPSDLHPIVKNDGLIRTMLWYYQDLDRANPRAEIVIEEVG